MRLGLETNSFAAKGRNCLKYSLLPKLYVEGSIPFARSIV